MDNPRYKSSATLRHWGGLISFGILEQILLSGASFAFAAIMARNLGARTFGWFSIAWSLTLFLEAGAWGLFGDAVPATAEKIRRSLRPEFRWSFLAASALFAALILGVVALAAIVVSFFAAGFVGLVFAIGVAFAAGRFQNAVRRLYYLDGLRKQAALAALVYVAVLAAASFAMIHSGMASPFLALFCMACANTVAALCFFFQGVELRRPSRRQFRWAVASLWRTGRWTLSSGIMSWLGNYGIIVVVGILLSVSASGTLRALLSLTTPMSQLNNVLLSIVVPKVAARIRQGGGVPDWGIAVTSMALFGGLNGTYSVLIIVFGTNLFRHLFGASTANVPKLAVALVTLGYTVESIRYGCNVVLLGRGKTAILIFSQSIALLSAALLIPPAAIYLGITGAVGAMTTANNVGTLVVTYYFWKLVRRTSSKEDLD